MPPSDETTPPNREELPADPGGQPGTITQAAAVREALRVGREKPGDAIAWIKSRYGLDVGRAAFSAMKSKERSRVAATQQDESAGPVVRRGPGRPRSRPFVPSAGPIGPPVAPAALIGPRESPPGREATPDRKPLVVPPPPTGPTRTYEDGPVPSPRPTPEVGSPEARTGTAAPVPRSIGWRELLDDLREIRRLKAKYGDELANMVQEI